MSITNLPLRHRALLSAFEAAPRPLKVPEAWDAVGRSVMSQATLYRAIARLVQGGQLRAVEIHDSPPLYEPANRGHHHHFYCTLCGQVFEIAKCPPRLNQLVPEGFRMTDHAITLYGECARCVT